jgi:DNA-binding transcriptional LysR family regulator
MQKNKILHLRGLQAFDAAATYSNFSKAADKLGVTHGAVSRQIRQLEEHIGMTLFNRLSAGVETTEVGEKLHEATRKAFSILECSLSEISRPRNNRSLRISLPSSLAVKWLVPKLSLFRARYPSISVSLDTDDHVIDFNTNKADVALRYIKNEEGNLFQKLILREVSYVVASPKLVKQFKLPMRPDDIVKLPLLRDNFNYGWKMWAAQVGIAENSIPKRTLELSDSAALISSALSGLGVALARAILLEEDLNSGRLVRLDDEAVPLENSLYVVCRSGNESNHTVAAFIDWLTSVV